MWKKHLTFAVATSAIAYLAAADTAGRLLPLDPNGVGSQLALAAWVVLAAMLVPGVFLYAEQMRRDRRVVSVPVVALLVVGLSSPLWCPVVLPALKATWCAKLALAVRWVTCFGTLAYFPTIGSLAAEDNEAPLSFARTLWHLGGFPGAILARRMFPRDLASPQVTPWVFAHGLPLVFVLGVIWQLSANGGLISQVIPSIARPNPAFRPSADPVPGWESGTGTPTQTASGQAFSHPGR